MSSRRLQDMSSRRLEDVFSVTIFRLQRRLQDVLREVLKTSSRRLRKASSRRLEGQQMFAGSLPTISRKVNQSNKVNTLKWKKNCVSVKCKFDINVEFSNHC